MVLAAQAFKNVYLSLIMYENYQLFLEISISFTEVYNVSISVIYKFIYLFIN